MDQQRRYICIDLKSYYASVECVVRGMDPLKTNLVVADASRTEKTICLAVSPSLKAWGISGRPRLFEVTERVREINAARLRRAPGHVFVSRSWDDTALKKDAGLALDFITATPRMALYMSYSAKIYGIYLQFVAPEDIHVYSVDEVFVDATAYLRDGRMTARDMAQAMVRKVLELTGITATAGIGTNLYLSKVAMDIVAKRMPPDENGVRIAELDELSYREQLWDHRPLTDFWRIGSGCRRRLEEKGLYTMGDVARCSLGREGEYYSEDLLYRIFGVNAQLLINHAWGWEPCTLSQIKNYRPKSSSLSSGQVLPRPYRADEARTVLWEMAELLALELTEKGLVTDKIDVSVGYDAENLRDPGRAAAYRGEVAVDYYGRPLPKHAHGSVKLAVRSASVRDVVAAALAVFDRTVEPSLLIRRIVVAAERVEAEEKGETWEQLDLFTDEETLKRREREEAARRRERERQRAVLVIKRKYGRNAILTGTNFREGATARERNTQIGGHRA